LYSATARKYRANSPNYSTTVSFHITSIPLFINHIVFQRQLIGGIYTVAKFTIKKERKEMSKQTNTVLKNQ